MTTQAKSEVSKSEKITIPQEKATKFPILRYVPLSRCKKGESPFTEDPKNLTIGSIEILKESFTTPLTKIEKGETKRLEKKSVEAFLPERRTAEGFDPKAYKLMAKASYDFTTRSELKSVKIFNERPKLSPTQKKLEKQGYSIPNSRAGVGYNSFEPIRISSKGKVKVVDTCHITVEESKDSKEGKKSQSQRNYVFDRITSPTPRPSVFQRLNKSTVKDKSQGSISGSIQLSAFKRFTTSKKIESASPTPDARESSFKRLSVSLTRGQKKPSIAVSSKHGLIAGNDEIHSVVPLRIKRKMFVSVNTEGSLKVKRHNVVFTRPENNELEDGVDVVSCDHVMIEEASNYEAFEEDVEAAPLSLEDGGQSTVDELKEVNLGMVEDPRPTFISAQLSDAD